MAAVRAFFLSGFCDRYRVDHGTGPMSAVDYMSHPTPLPTSAASADRTDIDACEPAPLIIVGTGPVGVRFATELFARGYDGPITMFGDEPWQPYNRVQLSALLAGDIAFDAIANPLAVPAGQRVVQHLNCAIDAIYPQHRCVASADGALHTYSRLVLATGSRAYIPNIVGVDKSGVFTLRNLRDTERLLARTARSRSIVVAGGGLLGLEAARALQRNGTRVTVVQQSERLMNRQLDGTAGDLLRARVAALGIDVRLGAGLAEIIGDERVTGVRLRDSSQIDCDTVLLATGIKPNIELARRCWIRVNQGIVVDDELQTSAPDIYAIGECAEHRERTYGIVAPGFEQAAALAANLTGDSARYRGSVDASELKVVGEAVFSVGDVAESAPQLQQREWVWQDKQSGCYRKLVTQRGRLVGALAIGANNENRRLREAVDNARPLRWWQLLRFRNSGRCWSEDSSTRVALWPATAVVCQCMGVTRGQLSACIEQGAGSVAALRAATRASSVCGSCGPLLQDLLGSDSRREAAAGAKWLLAFAVLSALLLALWSALPPLRVAETVQGAWHADSIWNDGTAKQITGFSVLGLAVVGSIMSLRKRVRSFRWISYGSWRVLHASVGALCVALLIAHTGLHGGVNFNRYLLLDFIAVLAVGALAALVLGREHKLASASARTLRTTVVWGHVLAVWPLPVLLIVHILTVYYF